LSTFGSEWNPRWDSRRPRAKETLIGRRFKRPHLIQLPLKSDSTNLLKRREMKIVGSVEECPDVVEHLGVNLRKAFCKIRCRFQ